MRTPVQEAKTYDSATAAKPLVETGETVLPISGIGMQARKRALRESRCVPARIAREAAAVKAETEAVADRQAQQAADAETHDAARDKADADKEKATTAAKAKAAKAAKAAAGGE